MLSRKDNIMAIAGIIVILIALTGSAIFEGEEPEGAGLIFNVTFSEKEEEVLNENGDTNEGQTTEIELEMEQENLVSMEFQLTWDDNLPNPISGPNDEFELTIMEPQDTYTEYDPSSSVSSTDEVITIQVTLQDFPKNKISEPGSSEEDVEKKCTTKNGTGTWTIQVTCNNAGDRDPTPFGQDDGNDWTLQVKVYYYVIKVTSGAISEE